MHRILTMATLAVTASIAIGADAQPSSAQVAPPSTPAVRAAPFQLTPAHETFVNQVLQLWEQESGKIKTYKCDFEHLQYIVAITGDQVPLHRNRGVLTYERPDKGSFEVTEVGTWNNLPDEPAWPIDENAVGEHYVCDGKKVYVYNHRAKQLEISPIPPEMQGKQIVDGPLPFLFGAEADKLRQRYWIRTTHSDQQEIWLDVWPKFAADAANYKQVEVILVREQLLPKAIKVYRPNGDSDVYLFDVEAAGVNNPLDRLFGAFAAPKKPFGWQVVEHPQPQGQAAPDPRPSDARRQGGGPARY